MEIFEKLFLLIAGLFLPALALAQEPGQMGNGMMDGHMMMDGMGVMGIFMIIICILLVVLLVLAILALIKYLRQK